MHRPGIEPGSLAWKAKVIPLDHRCRLASLVYTEVREPFGLAYDRCSHAPVVAVPAELLTTGALADESEPSTSIRLYPTVAYVRFPSPWTTAKQLPRSVKVRSTASPLAPRSSANSSGS